MKLTRENDKRINILLVEDEPGDAGLIRRALGRSTLEHFNVTWVQTLAQGCQSLAEAQYDLVLLDLSLPDSSGLETARAGCAAAGDTPLVVLTGRADPEFALCTLDAGAQDYLVKGEFNHNLLLRSLRYALARARAETTQRQSEAKLREKEHNYRAVFEGSRDAIIIISAKGDFLDCNQRAVELFCLQDKAEFSSTRPADLSPPLQPDGRSSREASRTYIDMAIKGREHVLFEWLHRRKSGETFPAEIILTAYPLSGEMILHSTIRDISDRKRAETALQESEAAKRILLDNIQTQVWYLTNEYTYGAVNQAHAAFNGVRIEDLAFKNMYDIFPKEIVEVCRQSNTEVFATGKAVRTEEWVPHVSGEERLISITKSPKLGDDGSVQYVVCSAEDITEQKKAGETLHYQLQLEKVVSDISSAFLPLPAEQIDAGINYALELTGKFFNVDRSYVFEFLSDGQAMSNTHEWCTPGIEPQLDRIQDFPVAKLPWWTAQLQNHAYVYIPDVNELPPQARAEREEFQRQGIQSLLSVPLRSEGRLLAFFGFDAVKEKKAWTEEQISFLQVIAGILVSAFEKSSAGQKINDYTMELELSGIELAELYRCLDAELDKARLLHAQTLPQSLPAVAGITFAAHYQPAQKLGGDYYNVLQKDQNLIIYLSDISGHGLDGAMLNIFVKEAINSYISLKPEALNPSQILQYLQARYCAEAYPGDYFVCIFLAVLELTTMELTYASAGFQTLPLIFQDGRQETLHSEGPPISTVFPPEAMVFEDKRRTLTPGATILFSTDGLLEQTDEHERPYGDTGRLKAVFYQNSHLPPQLLIKQINADFHNFTVNSAGIDDDITFLVMQLKPEQAETAHLELTGELQTTNSLRQKMEQILMYIEDRENFITCVLELVLNAIEHGHNYNFEKTVALTVTLTETYLQAVVEDQGAGFNWEEIIDIPLCLNGTRERGRGIPMIRLYCGNLFYNKKGNKATLIAERSFQKNSSSTGDSTEN